MLNLHNKLDRNRVLAKGKPEPATSEWWGEPNFGAWYTNAEIEAAIEAIRSSMHWSIGFGPDANKIREFEAAFAEYCNAKHAIAITSCGVGLDIGMMCLDLEPGDEIICPAINYKASQLAVIGQGGKVVFCDIDPKTLNLDPSDVESRITPRTRAICPVHQTGLAAPMDVLVDIAERNPHPKYGPLKIISDAARSCGAEHNGKKVGEMGWMTAFSFHSQKLMTTLGEGGMITTNDSSLNKRIRDICSFGGETGWGSNYRMNKVQAAVGLVQLERLDVMNDARRAAAQRRTMYLQGADGIVLPHEPSNYKHLYYIYPLLVESDMPDYSRNLIISIMHEKYGIRCAITNRPTYHRWPYIKEQCGTPDLPVTEDIGKRIFSPMLHPLLTEEQEQYICASLLESIDVVKNGVS